eukprot:5558022-Karenia_brevis.AAC.1
MDALPHLDYLGGRPSPPGLPGWTPGLPGWTTSAACITWMERLHCVHYSDGQLSLPGLLSLTGRLGWRIFTYLE